MNQKPATIKNNIIFDIDSATVAGGVFEFAYDKQGSCIGVRELFSLRSKITNGASYTFEEFWRRTQKTLETVATEVHLRALIPIDEIYCNISAPWSSSQKRTIKYTKKKDFIFTKELADELIETEINDPLSKNLDYHEYDVDLIDRKTVAIRANGYPVRDPIGKTMHDLEIDSLVTVMSEKTKEIFQHSIEKSFHRFPKFTSNIFVSYFDVEKSLPNTDDAIIIDVAGEMTEIMVIKNDHLESIGTLPNGIYHIIRDMADALNVSIAKAHKYIHLLPTEHLDHDHHIEIERALDAAYKKWLKEFYNFCDETSKKGLLPKTIVLKTYADSSAWFEILLLSSDELSEHMHARSAIELIHLHMARSVEKIPLDISDPELRVVAHTIALGEL